MPSPAHIHDLSILGSCCGRCAGVGSPCRCKTANRIDSDTPTTALLTQPLVGVVIQEDVLDEQELRERIRRLIDEIIRERAEAEGVTVDEYLSRLRRQA